MRRVYVTFSGAPYDVTTQCIVEDAKLFGVDEVLVYDDRWLMGTEFYRMNAWLWEHPHKRGFGWYAWKPYVIWDALSRLEDGDVVLYTDADTVPISNLEILFDHCASDGGVMLFASENHRQGQWCKQDCFLAMGQAGREYHDAPAGVARFALFQKGAWKASQFLMEWLTYSVNRRCTTFDSSVLAGEPSDFIEHRTEQAILTNLAHKYGCRLYREACGAGNGAGRDFELYGQLFRQINSDIDHVSAEPVGSRYCNI